MKHAKLILVVALLILFLSIGAVALPRATLQETKQGVAVTSSPSGADVYWIYKNDKNYMGKTPITFALPVGTHRVLLKYQGYLDSTRTIRVYGNKITRLYVSLEQDLATLNMGKLVITSVPSKANIYIDGNKELEWNNILNVDARQTPLNINLPIGKYNVQIAKQGYSDYKKTLEVYKGRTTSLNAKLSGCTESDRGINYYVKGKVTYADGGTNTDICINKNADGTWGNTAYDAPYLVEYSCPSGTSEGKNIYKCPKGCKDGICMRAVSSRAKELTTVPMNNKANTPEYFESIGNSYFTSFKNGTITIKRGKETYSVTETESIGVNIDAGFDTTHTNIKDLIATINSGDLNYVVDFGSGVVPCGYVDSGASDYAAISFLGKPYVIEQVDSDCTRIELVTETAERILKRGDTIDVAGRRARIKYKFKVVGGSTKSDGTYQAQIELQDARGNKLQAQSFTASITSPITFYDSTGNNLIATKVILKTISRDAASNTWNFTFMIGADIITIKNGERFPYDPTNTAMPYPWIGVISKDSTGTMVAKIAVKNQSKVWGFTNPLYSSTYSLKSTGNSKAVILEGSGLDTLGEVEFKGFYDSGVQKTTVKFLASGADVAGQATAYGNLEYYDAYSVKHRIPYAMKLSSVGYGSGTFTFEGQTYNFRAGSTPAAGTAESGISSGDGNFWFKTGSTIDSGTSLSDGNYSIDIGAADSWTDSGDIDMSGAIGVRSSITGGYNPIIKLYGRGQRYNYALKATPSGLWLVLTGYLEESSIITYGTGKIDDLQYGAGTIWLLGTDKDDSDGVSTLKSDSSSITDFILPYYAPDTIEFGANPGSSSGVFKTAVFKIKPITIGTTIPDYSDPANYIGYTIYVDTSDHKIVDTANISKANYTGKLTGLDYNSDLGGTRDYNINNLSEYTGSISTYTQAYDSNGVYMKLSNRELTMTIPNKTMNTYVVVKPK